MLSDKKRLFLLKHPWLVTYCASIEYPLTITQLHEYREILAWYSLASNRRIAWSAEILDAFIEELFPTPEQRARWDIPGSFLVSNPSVPWTTELLERYEDHIDWEQVVFFEILSPEQRMQFYHRIFEFEKQKELEEEQNFDENGEPIVFDLSDTAHLEYQMSLMAKHPELCFQQLEEIKEDEVNWEILSSNEFIPWNDEFIARHEDRWSWKNLSRNESLCWSEGLLSRYTDRWDWTKITINKGLPWSADLIDKFESHLHWDIPIITEEGYICKPPSTIGWNMSIPWTNEMLIAYHHKLYLEVILINGQVPWDFERFEIACEYGDSTKMVFHYALLQEIFPELLEEEHLSPLLDEILHNFRKGDYGKLPLVDPMDI